MSYHDYRFDRIDGDTMYKYYKMSFDNPKYYDFFIKAFIPLINQQFKRYEGSHITLDEFEDLVSDINIKVLKMQSNRMEFDEVAVFYGYLKTICQRTFVDKIDYYRYNISEYDYASLDDISLMYGNAHESIFTAIHFKDIIKLLILEFKKRIRFKGKLRVAILYVFDALMKGKAPDINFLSVKYSVDGDYIDSYTRVLIRSVLYDLSLTLAFED